LFDSVIIYFNVEKYFNNTNKKLIPSEYEKDENFKGIDEVKEIAKEYNIEDINKVKPGVGETTRVLLRRVPDRVIVNKNTTEKEHIKKVKSSETSNYFVVMKNSKIIGCIGFNGNTARKMKHYGTIGISVLKEYWGRGIATTLLEKLISWSKEKGIKKINLDVFENNERAIKLYEKFGFKLEGCIEDGIFDGENYINLLVYGLKI